MIMVEWPTYLVYDCLGFIVALTGNEVLLAAFTLGDTIYLLVESVFMGLGTFMRTELNITIGENNVVSFRKKAKSLFFSTLLIGFSTLLVQVIAIEILLATDFIENEELREEFDDIQYYLYTMTLYQAVDIYLVVMTKGLGYLSVLSISNIVSNFVMIVLAYYLAITRNWGIWGAQFSNFLSLFYRVLLLLWLNFIKLDFKKELQRIRNQKLKREEMYKKEK